VERIFDVIFSIPYIAFSGKKTSSLLNVRILEQFRQVQYRYAVIKELGNYQIQNFE
jgi:hypothetical protein